jgi:hypothetical protein
MGYPPNTASAESASRFMDPGLGLMLAFAGLSDGAALTRCLSLPKSLKVRRWAIGEAQIDQPVDGLAAGPLAIEDFELDAQMDKSTDTLLIASRQILEPAGLVAESPGQVTAAARANFAAVPEKEQPFAVGYSCADCGRTGGETGLKLGHSLASKFTAVAKALPPFATNRKIDLRNVFKALHGNASPNR